MCSFSTLTLKCCLSAIGYPHKHRKTVIKLCGTCVRRYLSRRIFWNHFQLLTASNFMERVPIDCNIVDIFSDLPITLCDGDNKTCFHCLHTARESLS